MHGISGHSVPRRLPASTSEPDARGPAEDAGPAAASGRLRGCRGTPPRAPPWS